MAFEITPLTPNHLKLGARATLCLLVTFTVSALLMSGLTQQHLSLAVFCIAAALLMAAPNARSSVLLGLLAIGITISEFAAGHLLGGLNIMRWANLMVIPGAIMLIVKIQHWRALSRTGAHVSLRLLERRKFRDAKFNPRPAALPTEPAANTAKAA